MEPHQGERGVLESPMRKEELRANPSLVPRPSVTAEGLGVRLG